MRKFIMFCIIVGLGCWAWFFVGAKTDPYQSDPTMVVNAFMNSVKTINSLLWDKKALAELREDLDKWGQEAVTDKAELPPEFYKKYQVARPDALTKNKRFGKAAFGVLCLYHFDKFDAVPIKVEEKKAVVEARFKAKDFMGLGSLMKTKTDTNAFNDKEIAIVFHLARSFYKWYIVNIEGTVGELINAQYKSAFFEN